MMSKFTGRGNPVIGRVKERKERDSRVTEATIESCNPYLLLLAGALGSSPH